MSRQPERDKIKAERAKHRKQSKRQHRDEAKAKREAKWNEKLSRMNIDATIPGSIKRTIGEIEANRKQEEAERKREEEAERDFKRWADELAAKVKAKIEADRAAGRETDLWEWLKYVPCVVTKALRERGISFGKRKR